MTIRLLPPTWTVTSVLEQSYRMARDNFSAFFTISLVFGAVSMVIDVLSLGLLGGVGHLVCGAAATICITWGALRILKGDRPGWEPMLRQVQAPLFVQLLLVAIVQYLVIMLSAFLIIPPLFLLPLWAVTIPAMMVERTDFVGAFNRSVELTRNRRLQILGAFMLWTVLFLVGAAALVMLLGQGALARLVLWLYGALAATVVYPLPALLYVLLRGEKEGLTPLQVTAPVP